MFVFNFFCWLSVYLDYIFFVPGDKERTSSTEILHMFNFFSLDMCIADWLRLFCEFLMYTVTVEELPLSNTWQNI
jgi:hypothetical protein